MNPVLHCCGCGVAVYRARVKMRCQRCRHRPLGETLKRNQGLLLTTSLGTFVVTVMLDLVLRIVGLL